MKISYITEMLGRSSLYMVVYLTCGYVLWGVYGVYLGNTTGGILGLLGLVWVITPIIRGIENKEKK